MPPRLTSEEMRLQALKVAERMPLVLGELGAGGSDEVCDEVSEFSE